jgi:hypothetical protein
MLYWGGWQHGAAEGLHMLLRGECDKKGRTESNRPELRSILHGRRYLSSSPCKCRHLLAQGGPTVYVLESIEVDLKSEGNGQE